MKFINSLLFLFLSTNSLALEYFYFLEANHPIKFGHESEKVFGYQINNKFKYLVVDKNNILQEKFIGLIKWIKPVRNLEKPRRINSAARVNLNEEGNHHQLLNSYLAKKLIKKDKSIQDIIVAVPDLGMNINHPALKGKIHTNKNEIPNNGIDDDKNGLIDDIYGWNFCDNNGDVYPEREYDHHGNHIAGILAAQKMTNSKAVGVAEKVKVLPILWYEDYCRWNEKIIVKSFVYAVDQGAKFINSSYNIDQKIDANIFKEVMAYISFKGAMIVNSAGNNKKKDPNRLKNQDIIFVSSVDQSFNRSKFSNYGLGVDFSAPAEKVLSIGLNRASLKLSGTSMAAPMVIATLINLKQFHKIKKNEELVSIAMRTANKINVEQGLGVGSIKFEQDISCQKFPFLISKNIEKAMNRRSHLRKVKSLSWRVNGILKNSLEEIEQMIKVEPKVSYYTEYHRALGNNYIRINFQEFLPPGRYSLKLNTGYIEDYSGCPLQVVDGSKAQTEFISIR